MVIQHNMQSENGNGIFKRVNRDKRRGTERLSTGYRINRAADDAAGLAISEKLRTQIRGLSKAGDNIQNGISLLQTADGAMGEISNVIHRMRELCVQGANDTNAEADRDAIQQELNQMSQCIDDILEHTEFNTMKILKLGDAYIDYIETVVGKLPPNVKMPDNLLQIGPLPSFPAGISYASAVVDFSAITSAADVQALVDTGFYTTCCTCDNKYNIRFVDNGSEPSKNVGRNPVFDVNIHGMTNGADVVKAIVQSVKTNHFTRFMADPADGGKLIVYDYRPGQTPNEPLDRGILKPELIRTEAVITDPGNMQIQVGPNARQLVSLNLPTFSSAILGVDMLNVNNNMIANHSLEMADEALSMLSLERANIGALQNRLEHAYEYAMSAEENQQAAESRIRDTDMADEMVAFSAKDIIAQVAQSMIAQSNSRPEAILTLLR